MIVSPMRPMAWRVRADHRDRAEVVQDVLGRHRRRPDPATRRTRGPRGSTGLRWWQTISMSRCSSRVLRVYGRVGLVDDGRTFGVRGDPDDVRRVPAPGPLGVVRVDRPAADRGERRLEVAGLVQRVGVDRHLHPGLDATVRQASIAAGVVPQSSCSLKPGGPGAQLLPQPLGRHRVALAEQHDVHRPRGASRAASRRARTPRASPWWPWCPRPARCRRRSAW